MAASNARSGKYVYHLAHSMAATWEEARSTNVEAVANAGEGELEADESISSSQAPLPPTYRRQSGSNCGRAHEH